MKKFNLFLFLSVFFICIFPIYSSEEYEIISLYENSRLMHDDRLGYEEYYIFIEDEKVKTINGIMRRRASIAPVATSSLEILRNYEQIIEKKGGQIIYSTRSARDLVYKDKNFWYYYSKNRLNHTRNYEYMRFPRGINEYLVAKLPYGAKDVYIILGVASPDGRAIYELITVEIDDIKLDKVSMDSLIKGINIMGKVPVYEILFDFASYRLQEESDEALKIIADFLNENQNKKFLIVGHTDNVGNFYNNIELSLKRAESVVERLTKKYSVNKEQLKAYGVGSTSPVSSNNSEDGRTRNRRVEVVEY